MCPNSPRQGSSSGKALPGRPVCSRKASIQQRCSRSISSVRLALLISLPWRCPAVRFQSSQDSTVPKHRSPWAAAAAASE